MNPYFNDNDFGARHEHYRDMLRAAEANIELRRGELAPGRHMPAWAKALCGLAPAVVRRLAALRAPMNPCSDAAPCE